MSGTPEAVVCEKRNTHSCPMDPSWAAQLCSHGPECILKGQPAGDVFCLGPVHRPPSDADDNPLHRTEPCSGGGNDTPALSTKPQTPKWYPSPSLEGGLFGINKNARGKRLSKLKIWAKETQPRPQKGDSSARGLRGSHSPVRGHMEASAL